MRRSLIALVLSASSFLFSANSSPAQFLTTSAPLSGVGVVVLHGTQATSYALRSLPGALRAEGATVSIPEMAWSQWRIYDSPFDEQVKVIDAEIARLRAGGASRVYLAGHSAGAAAAIAYAARKRGADGLVVLATGGVSSQATPEQIEQGRDIIAETRRAEDLVQSGRGDEWGLFLALNSTRSVVTSRFYTPTTARIYLDYVGPQSKLNVDRAAAQVRYLPILWINGLEDPLLPSQRAASQKALKHRLSEYREIHAYHGDVPDLSGAIVANWLKKVSSGSKRAGQ
jgi:pimeloyl-ACP methyl ester carboxylesterase